MNLHLLSLFSASSISGISRECAYSWYSGSWMSHRRDEPQIGYQAGGRFVDVGGIGDPVVFRHERKYIVKRNGHCIDEQIFHSPGYFVFLIHDLLLPEDVLPVREGHEF